MIGRYRRELSVAAAYVALLLVLAVANPRFFRPDQLRDIVVSKASVLVAAVGMTLVILCRHIDISIGSIFSICGVVAGLLSRAGLNIAVVGLGTLLAGGSLGAVNGVLIARLGLPSIVVTLATLVIWREALRYAREGAFVRNLPPGFQWFGAGQAMGQWLVVALALGVFSLLPGACATLRSDERSTPRGPIPKPRGSRASGLGAWYSASLSPSARWQDWPPCSTPSASPMSTPTPEWGWSFRSSRPWWSEASRFPVGAGRSPAV